MLRLLLVVFNILWNNFGCFLIFVKLIRAQQKPWTKQRKRKYDFFKNIPTLEVKRRQNRDLLNSATISRARFVGFDSCFCCYCCCCCCLCKQFLMKLIKDEFSFQVNLIRALSEKTIFPSCLISVTVIFNHCKSFSQPLRPSWPKPWPRTRTFPPHLFNNNRKHKKI